MSACRDCGGEIVWAKRPDSRWVPLEEVSLDTPGLKDLLGDVLVVVNGVAHPAEMPTFYVRHTCGKRQPASVGAWVGAPTGVVAADPDEEPTTVRPAPVRSDNSQFVQLGVRDADEARRAADSPEADHLLRAYGTLCPYCGARPYACCTTPSGQLAGRIHSERITVVREPSRPVGPYGRSHNPYDPHSWAHDVAYSRGGQPWRKMRHWLFDHGSLLTSLSTAPADVPPDTGLKSTQLPTTPECGSAESAGSPADSYLRSPFRSSTDASNGAGLKAEDVPDVLRPGDAKPDRARDEGDAR